MHDLDTTFRARAELCIWDSGSKFCDVLVRVWSHSYLTCGEVLDLLLSKWPRGHSVVQLIVFWWFANLGPHMGDLTAGLLFVWPRLHACFRSAGCVSEQLMRCGNLHFISFFLSLNLSSSDAMEMQCSYHSPSAQCCV